MRILKCKHCQNIITYLDDKKVTVSCCGESMAELIPGVVDASLEKHLPIVVEEGNTVFVTVGEVLHPMTEEHLIEWVLIETTKGFQIKYLKAGDEPIAKFELIDNEVLISVYAYCNLHGLWKK